ncbi:hypothetical protein GGI43DRAFT_417622 [Trichoderma evansii]
MNGHPLIRILLLIHSSCYYAATNAFTAAKKVKLPLRRTYCCYLPMMILLKECHQYLNEHRYDSANLYTFFRQTYTYS